MKSSTKILDKRNLEFLESIALRHKDLSLLGFVFDLEQEKKQQNKKRTE